MKRCILFVWLAISLSGVFAFTNATLLFLSFEPSAANYAMGGSPVGAANIWQSSAISAWGNPALPAMGKGLTVSYNRYPWYLGPGTEDMRYSASFMSLGYKGFGLLLPTPNGHRAHLGINFDAGEMIQTDSDGNFVCTYNSFDNASVLGASINPVEVLRCYQSSPQSWLDYVDFGLGLNFVSTYSFMGFRPDDLDEEIIGHDLSLNLGLIAKTQYEFGDLLRLEAAGGLTISNLTRSQISFDNGQNNEPVFRSSNLAGAASISVPARSLGRDMIDPKYIFCKNLFSLRAMTGSIDSDLMSLPDEGKGLEFGFLDTVFIRQGRFDDGREAKTAGYGVKLHYKDLFALVYNHSEAGDGNAIIKESDEYSVNFDLLKLIGLMR